MKVPRAQGRVCLGRPLGLIRFLPIMRRLTACAREDLGGGEPVLRTGNGASRTGGPTDALSAFTMLPGADSCAKALSGWRPVSPCPISLSSTWPERACGQKTHRRGRSRLGWRLFQPNNFPADK
jgi:hypothetical protein